MLIYRLVRPAPLKAVIQAPTEPVKLYYHEARTESSAFSSKVSLLSFFTVYLPQSGRFDSCITTVYTLCRAFFHLKFTNCIGLFFRFRFFCRFLFLYTSFFLYYEISQAMLYALYFPRQFAAHPLEDLSFPAGDLYLRRLQDTRCLALSLTPKKAKLDQKTILRRKLIHNFIQADAL